MQIIDSLINLSKSVGHNLLENRTSLLESSFWEFDQLKTKADRNANDILNAKLPLIRDIPIISEENTDFRPVKRPVEYWLIDPIDGTRSYAENFPGWVTQIALIKNDMVVLSVVHCPELAKTYFAVKHEGAYCNSERLNKLATKKLLITIIDNYPKPTGITKKIYTKLNCDAYLECGSLGLKICQVADGTADLFCKDVVVRDWDIAPPSLILSEVGGVLTTYDEEDFFYTGSFEKHGLIVANNSYTYEKCRKIIGLMGD
jgi:3'-phosphoadenosine 5'-phosphosulfate (PAPS) 3'-phosphatase